MKTKITIKLTKCPTCWRHNPVNWSSKSAQVIRCACGCEYQVVYMPPVYTSKEEFDRDAEEQRKQWN